MKNRIFQFKFMLFNVCVVLLAGFSNPVVYCQIPIGSPGKTQVLLNEVVDISGDFRIFSNTYYLADSLSSFDPENGTGKVLFKRYEYSTRQAFNNMLAVLCNRLKESQRIDLPPFRQFDA